MFKKISKNLNESKIMYNLISMDIKKYIRENNDDMTNKFTKLLVILSVTLIENTYYSLAFNPELFNKEKRDKIISKYRGISLKVKWQSLILFIVDETLTMDNYRKKILNKHGKVFHDLIVYLINVIDKEVSDITLLRNKFAHGDFYYAFTENKDNFNALTTRKIHKINYYDCERIRKVFLEVKTLIHNLGQSRETLLRDFDNSYKKIEKYSNIYSKENYKKFKKEIQGRYNRGKVYKSEKM